MLFYEMCLQCATLEYPFENKKMNSSGGKNHGEELPFCDDEEDDAAGDFFQKLNLSIFNETQDGDFHAVVHKSDNS